MSTIEYGDLGQRFRWWWIVVKWVKIIQGPTPTRIIICYKHPDENCCLGLEIIQSVSPVQLLPSLVHGWMVNQD